MMEFHISRKARTRYSFAESLFSYSGNVIFANVAACREFAYRMNTVRDVERHPELAVHAGKLYAMGLIDEASHVLMARYREQIDPAVFTQALEWFSGAVGAEPLGRLLLTFVEEFPGISVMRGQLTARKWLSGETDGISHWAVAMEELLLLWTANRNEAFKPFEELFEEKSLAERTVYREVTRQFPEFFATRPLIPVAGAKSVSLLELLRAPAVTAPGSLSEQLKLIRALWRPLLGESLDHYLEIATEILHEEELAIWMQFNPGAVSAAEAARRHRESGLKQWPGVVSTADVPSFAETAHEYEKFSPDMAWMPTAVMIAKSTYVWLAQLSRQYGRAIHRLDEIPDEELATLARRGLNTLWLIGVWERSRASKTIKQLCGNSDAVASAYSLFDYTIADDLGGEAAYVHLRDRAFHHGIRLASDMVPNHMGIDSPWVVEHPDWFIGRGESPYPVYSFNGPDLSQDGRVEIKIEDHYFEESDAAVVFRRRDQQSGETRYIYHGNDGTSFPWNDTAQLDYLNPAVREQVIQTILHVARLFPVIRFDAAMTLAKRHFHRLWFPGPGASGAIPSRAEYGMSQAEFNAAMPQEFWREVVDRVAAEVPGTLLLAEAFWLMEGYFVRTLGMHRVYNSAFMVMLRDEDNAKYREVIKKTIEFDVDILKRYVNFMSNPDERTAIDQFGKGDKCFGVAAMMATLPGLPMFGHGQIEGFTEKYGMEYQRPRYDEDADKWLVERHEREIAPLLKRRRLFAESDNFLLYDFYLDAGQVDENVFAYSNRVGGRSGDERALVVFNNRYAETRGTIDWSAAYADKRTSQLRQQKVSEGLGFGNAGKILAWRDSLNGQEYLRRASDLTERGLLLELHAYQCHVFLDWRELTATAEQPWDRLCDQLNGRGVASLEDALVKLELQPAHDALRRLLEPGMVRGFASLAEHPRTLAKGANAEIEAERAAYFEAAWTRCESFLLTAQRAYTTQNGAALPTNPGLLRAAYRARLRAAMRIPAMEMLFPAPWTVAARRMLPCPSPQLTATAMWGPVLGWCALGLLAESIDVEKPEAVALDLFDRLRLREPFALAFGALGFEGEEAWRVAARVKVGLLTGAGVGGPEKAEEAAPVEGERVALAPALWLDPDLRWLTGVHEAEGREYLVRESYEELLWWLLMPSLLRMAGEAAPGLVAANRAAVRAMSRSIEAALETAEEAGYRVDLLLGPAESAGVETDAKVETESAEAGSEPAGAVVEAPLLVEKKETIEPEIAEAAAVATELEPTAEIEPPPGVETEPEEPRIAETTESVAEPEAEAVTEAAVETVAEKTESPEEEPVDEKELTEPEAAEAANEAAEPVEREIVESAEEIGGKVEIAGEIDEKSSSKEQPSEQIAVEPELIPDTASDPALSAAEQLPIAPQIQCETIASEESISSELLEKSESPENINLSTPEEIASAPESSVETQPSPEKVDEPVEREIEPHAAAVDAEAKPDAESVEAAAVAGEISSPTETSEPREEIEPKLEEKASEAEAVLELPLSSGELADKDEPAIAAAAKADEEAKPEAAEPETKAEDQSAPETEIEPEAAKAEGTAAVEAEPTLTEQPAKEVVSESASPAEPANEAPPSTAEPQEDAMGEIEATVGFVGEPEPAIASTGFNAAAAKSSTSFYPPKPAAPQIAALAEAGAGGSADEDEDVVVYLDDDSEDEAADENEDGIEYLEDGSEEEDEAEDVIEYIDEEEDEISLSGDEEPDEPEAESATENEVEVIDTAEVESEPDLPAEEAEETAEEAVEEAEAEEEESEVRPPRAKGLVGTIASIFARKQAAGAETITLGLNDAPNLSAETAEEASADDDANFDSPLPAEEEAVQMEEEEKGPAPMEPFEPAASDITVGVESSVILEPKQLATVPRVPSLTEPFEPPAPEIEFQAKSPSEVAAERRRRIGVPEGPGGDPEARPKPRRRSDD